MRYFFEKWNEWKNALINFPNPKFILLKCNMFTRYTDVIRDIAHIFLHSVEIYIFFNLIRKRPNSHQPFPVFNTRHFITYLVLTMIEHFHLVYTSSFTLDIWPLYCLRTRFRLKYHFSIFSHIILLSYHFLSGSWYIEKKTKNFASVPGSANYFVKKIWKLKSDGKLVKSL